METEGFKTLDKHLFFNIKKAYESQKHDPKTIQETEQLYIAMIKHLTNKEFIITKRIWSGKDRGARVYTVDDELVRHHIELHKIGNKMNKNYHDAVREKYNLEQVVKVKSNESEDPFIDD